MRDRLKSLFKLNNWKRIFILVFSVCTTILFIGLSFGLYSKKNSFTNEYKSGIQLTIKPTSSDSTTITDPAYINQIYHNLSTRLEQRYPDNNFEIKNENGVINIKSTNVNTEIEKNAFIKSVVNKQQLLFTTIDDTTGTSFYKGQPNLLFSGVGDISDNSYTLKFNNVSDSKKLIDDLKYYDKNSDTILIWKDFDIYKKIVEQNQADDNINSTKYNGSYYAYLFEAGLTPEKIKANESDNNFKAIFKKDLIYKDENGQTHKYQPDDFLVSKTLTKDLEGKSEITVKKDFEVVKWELNKKKLDNEHSFIKYWLSPYALNDYTSSGINPDNGSNSFIFVTIVLVSFFAIISIFVVINYGYLGIIALLLLSIVIFLSLLMITVFIGDYNTATILSILLPSILSFDILVLFFEKIKKEVKKGNSIPKSVKNTIKISNKNDYIKSFLLIFLSAIVYVFVSQFYGLFSLISLTTIVFLPIVMILLLRLLSTVFIGLKKFQNDGRTIGFWKKGTYIAKDDDTKNSDDNYLMEQIEVDQKNEIKLNESSKYKFLAKTNKKGFFISFGLFLALIFGGLIVFLSTFFTSGSGLNLTKQQQSQTVLRVGKNNNLTDSEVQAIKSELINEHKIKSEQISVTKDNLIELYFNKEEKTETINNITSQLISKYNVKVIQSKLTDSDTYKTMMFVAYGILTAIVLICVFVIFWMNWTKALSLLITMIMFGISFVAVIFLGFVPLSIHLTSLALFAFMIFLANQLNSLIRYNGKLKTRRIEELQKQDINELINKVTFRNLKSTIIFNSLIIITLLLFAIFVGSLPVFVPLVLLAMTIINLVFTIFLLPKLLIFFENIRAKANRKRILNNYWDTERVKEQVFSGINNVK